MKKITILHIIHQAGKLTESTPNLTISYLQKMCNNSYVFSMIKPLHLKGNYSVMYLSPYKYISFSHFVFLIKNVPFCFAYILKRKSQNKYWISTNVFNLIRFIYLYHFIKGKKITHVNCFFGNIGEFFVQLKCFIEVTVSVSFHGIDTSNHLLTKYTNLKKYSNAYFVLANYMKNDLLKADFKDELIYVVKTGLDFSKMPQYKKQIRKKQILFVGRLVEKKAILDVIKTFEILSKKFIHYSLIIVGDGPLKSIAQRTANDLNLHNRVVFLGKQYPDSVYKIMLESKVFFLPSKTASTGDKEGAPVSIIEAQLLGLPIVSTYHAGIPEVVIENKTALLSKEGDIHNLAFNLEKLLSNESLWNSFSKNAVAYTKERYNITIRAKKIMNILEDI